MLCLESELESDTRSLDLRLSLREKDSAKGKNFTPSSILLKSWSPDSGKKKLIFCQKNCQRKQNLPILYQAKFVGKECVEKSHKGLSLVLYGLVSELTGRFINVATLDYLHFHTL